MGQVNIQWVRETKWWDALDKVTGKYDFTWNLNDSKAAEKTELGNGLLSEILFVNKKKLDAP